MRYRRNIDVILIVSALLIFAIGLTFIYSATYNANYKNNKSALQSFVVRQLIWFMLSVLVGIIVIVVDYQKWLELAFPFYALNLLFLLLVLLIGPSRLGAQRWISLGQIAFQPSEFSKLALILALARYLGLRETGSGLPLFREQGFGYGRELAAAFLLCALPFALTVKQPDLGTALTLIPILAGMIYIWGAPIKTFLLVFAAGILSSPFLWQMLKDYQKRRILVFINPNQDPLGAGYTVIQSKIAIGSGGLWGRGWLSGTQNQLNFLPERHTDFIFSVAGEEWGFAGALLLLILYFILIWRAYSCARQTSNLAGRLLAVGITVMFSFQVSVNIAMTMGLVPVVGLPLPLISYGGSSLLTSIIAIALLLNVGLRRTVF